MFLFWGVSTLCGAVAIANAQDHPIFGNEIFVTMSTDTASGWTCGWRRFGFRPLGGGPLETIDFMPGNITACGFPPPCGLMPTGYGQYGQTWTEGNYIFEPFWYSQAFGNQGGILALASIPVPSIGYLQYVQQFGIAPGNRMGLRFSRIDGLPFILESLDYLTAASSFEFGTRLQSYADFASYLSVAPVLGSSNLETLLFPIPSGTVNRVQFVASAAAIPVFNSSTNSLQVSATIESYEWTNGVTVRSAMFDPLIGGYVQCVGSFGGNDLTTLAGFTLPSATITIATPTGTDALVVGSGFAAGPTFWRLAGPLGTYPSERRPITQTATSTPARIGSGSTALDSIQSSPSAQSFTLEFQLGSVPILVGLDKPLIIPPTGQTQFKWVDDGAGGAQFGVIQMAAGSTFFNFIDVAPPWPVGSGPFFGIGFGPAQIAQLSAPLGTHPLHAAPDPNGAYFWACPPGTVPPGLVADVLWVELPLSGGVLLRSITRLMF